MKQKKIIVIGLDGATWDILKPWIINNKLPNMNKMMKNGCYGSMESTIPFVTPPAWTSMVTGKNPGNHGVFDFFDIERTENGLKMNLYSSKSKKSKELWDYIDGKSIVVNVPLTYPPRKINGIMVTGMYTPDIKHDFTYPKKIKNEIIYLFPDYKTELDWEIYQNKKDDFFKDLYRMTEERKKLFWYFYRMNWSLFFFVFIGTDRLQHFTCDEVDLLEYYRYLDNFLGEVIKSIQGKNINLFLVSDHGFAKIKKRLTINSFLIKEKYLRPLNDKKRNFLRTFGLNREKIKETLIRYNLIESYKKLPPIISHFFSKNIPGKTHPIYDFDLKNSKAVMFGSGCIYFLGGKKFIKQEIEEEIIRKLENLKNPDNGDNIIDKVFRKDEIYSGKYLNKAPDLLILPKKGYSIENSISKYFIEEPQFKKADHALNGIFLAYGPNIKVGKEINIKIYDVTPTILHIFNIPIPKDMDGRVLKEIFKKDSELFKKKIIYKRYDNEKQKLDDIIKSLKLSGKT